MHPVITLRSFHRILIRATMVMIAIAIPAFAAPGDFDPSFGFHGFAYADVVRAYPAIAVQPDGKILAGGSTEGGFEDFALVRFTASGELDDTFGDGGEVITSLSDSGQDIIEDLAVQSDGRIVAAGFYRMARYTSDGMLDTSFNGTGQVVLPGTGCSAVALDSQGRIVVAGFGFSAVRYLPDGSLDASFNETGKAETEISDYHEDRCHGMAVQSDDKIVLAGSYYNGSVASFALVRYTATGALDTTFNGTGIVTTPETSSGEAHDIAVQSDGKLVAVGRMYKNGEKIVVARYHSNGTLDTGFGSAGLMYLQVDGFERVAHVQIAVQADDRLVVAASVARAKGSFQPVALRLLPNGDLDPAFHGTGMIPPITEIGSPMVRMALQSDGKIVLGAGDWPTTLVRLEVAGEANVLASKAGVVPRAGEDPDIPSGALWSGFGAPGINDAGQVAFQAEVKAGASRFQGIFAGTREAPALLAKTGRTTGNVAPGVAGAVFTKLEDPLLAHDGAVAWLGRLGNASGVSGVKPGNNSGIWLDSDGEGSNPGTLLARTGGEPAGIPGGEWKAFTSVALGTRALVFTASMITGKGDVAPGNDTGLWIYRRSSATLSLVLREGDALLESTVKTIGTLTVRNGAAGQGRGVESRYGQDQIVLRVSLADGRQAVGVIDESGTASFPYVSREFAVGMEEYANLLVWRHFGQPLQNTVGSIAFLGAVQSKYNVSKSTNLVGIFAQDDIGFVIKCLMATGDMTPGVPGGTFTRFSDPVNGRDRSLAFIGTLANRREYFIGPESNRGIWWRDGSGAWRLVARTGTYDPRLPYLVEWAGFLSVALPESAAGPLFTAKVAGRGVTAANDLGLWSTDADGLTHRLLSEGDFVNGRKVKSFSVLSDVHLSRTQTRSFNNTGEVILRVTDTTGAQHLVIVQVP